MSIVYSNAGELARDIQGLLGNAGSSELAAAMADQLWFRGVRSHEEIDVDPEFFALAERLEASISGSDVRV